MMPFKRAYPRDTQTCKPYDRTLLMLETFCKGLFFVLLVVCIGAGGAVYLGAPTAHAALPPLLRTFSSDQPIFISSEFDGRIRQTYRVRSDERGVIASLDGMGFKLNTEIDPHTAVYTQEKFLCASRWTVTWRTDDVSRISEIGGLYETNCL